MKKHWFKIVLIFALTVILLTGCTANKNLIFEDNTGAQAQTRLTFFGYKYEALNVAAIEDALGGYMNAHTGVNISYESLKSVDYYKILDKRLATGNGDDIFMVDHERTLELSAQNMLADLSDISTLNSFSSLAKSQMLAGDSIYYLPTSISAFGLYCNTTLLKKHNQKIPENLTELERVCNYFTSVGITPIVANNDISLKTVVIAKAFLPLYQSPDAAQQIERFNNGDADLAEALKPGFELVESIIGQNWVDADEALSTAKTKDDLTTFAKGEQPFMLTGAWATPRLRELNPNFEFEVHPYPILDDGNVLVINIDTRVSINADSPNIEEAKRFVEYLTQKDVMWKFVDSQSSFSPLEDNRLSDDKAISSIAPYLTNGRSVIGSDDNLKLPIWELTRQCVVEMLRGANAEETVAFMRSLIGTWNFYRRGSVQ